MILKNLIKVILVLCIFLLILVIFSLSETKLERLIKKFLPNELEDNIRSLILYFPEKNQKKDNEIKKLREEILNLKFNETQMDLEDSYITLFNYYSNNLETLIATKKKSELKKINNKEILIEHYSIDKLFNGKHSTAQATIYLEQHNDNLILATGDGHFFFVNKYELDKNVIKFKKIKSNIHEIITDINFFTKSKIGIKDILINNNEVIITFPLQRKKDCYSYTIYNSKFNFENLTFSKFFETKECTKTRGSNHFGGRIKSLDKNYYIFTTGDYGYTYNSQNEKNLFGKIVKIDKKTKNTEIISFGHRNPQGLFYDRPKNIILSTEHGPTGGDEINLIDLNNNDKKNYGWPHSSYGTDPGGGWVKNHSSKGYIEPIKYFVPGIAISEIIKAPKKLLNSDNKFLIAAMGGIPDGGYQSLHAIELSEDRKKILDHNIIKIFDRVRDLIVLEDYNVVIGSTEMNPGIFRISTLR